MAIYSLPITWSKLSRITWITKKNLSLMVRKGRINEDSLHKPVRYNSFAPLTEEQRKAVNYGWEIPVYDTFAMMAEAVSAKETDDADIWIYRKPRGLNYVENGQTYNEQFRAQDFNGYNSDATNPFDLQFDGAPYIGSSLALYFPIHPKELLDWGEWSSYKGKGTLQLGIYVPDVGYWPLTGNVGGGATIEELDITGDSIRMNITNSFASGNTYRAYIVLTTFNPTNTTLQKWWSATELSNYTTDYWYVIATKTTTPIEFTVQTSAAADPLNNYYNISVQATADYSQRDNQISNIVITGTATLSGNYTLNGITPDLSIVFKVPNVAVGDTGLTQDVQIGSIDSGNEGITSTPYSVPINISYAGPLRFNASGDNLTLKVVTTLRETANTAAFQRVDIIEVTLNYIVTN